MKNWEERKEKKKIIILFIFIAILFFLNQFDLFYIAIKDINCKKVDAVILNTYIMKGKSFDKYAEIEYEYDGKVHNGEVSVSVWENKNDHIQVLSDGRDEFRDTILVGFDLMIIGSIALIQILISIKRIDTLKKLQ